MRIVRNNGSLNIRNPWRESWESASEWVPYYWRSLGGSIGATPYRSTSRRPGRVANQATTATKKPMLMSIMFRCRHPRHHSINPFSIPKTDIFWKKIIWGRTINMGKRKSVWFYILIQYFNFDCIMKILDRQLQHRTGSPHHFLPSMS